MLKIVYDSGEERAVGYDEACRIVSDLICDMRDAIPDHRVDPPHLTPTQHDSRATALRKYLDSEIAPKIESQAHQLLKQVLHDGGQSCIADLIRLNIWRSPTEDAIEKTIERTNKRLAKVGLSLTISFRMQTIAVEKI